MSKTLIHCTAFQKKWSHISPIAKASLHFVPYSEIVKLCRNFSHPAKNKLNNHLKLVKPRETDRKIRELLGRTTSRCNACQRFPSPLILFKVSLSTDRSLEFGDDLPMELMFFKGRAVLNIVDTATYFSAVTFFDEHCARYWPLVERLCLALVNTWAKMYTRYPN